MALAGEGIRVVRLLAYVLLCGSGLLLVCWPGESHAKFGCAFAGVVSSIVLLSIDPGARPPEGPA